MAFSVLLWLGEPVATLTSDVAVEDCSHSATATLISVAWVVELPCAVLDFKVVLFPVYLG